MSEHKTKRVHPILMFIFALILGFVLASGEVMDIKSISLDEGNLDVWLRADNKTIEVDIEGLCELLGTAELTIDQAKQHIKHLQEAVAIAESTNE